MRIDNQLHILGRLSELNGNSEAYEELLKDSFKGTLYDGSIEDAIHHEIDKLERKEELAKELYAGKQKLLAKRVHRNGSRAQRLADEKRGGGK